eukprot:8857811-Alexandrium_andersonii.AAC.1
MRCPRGGDGRELESESDFSSDTDTEASDRAPSMRAPQEEGDMAEQVRQAWVASAPNGRQWRRCLQGGVEGAWLA